MSHETVLKFIRTTRSATGFRCRARLDTTDYQTKVKVSAEAKAGIQLRRHEVLPKWTTRSGLGAGKPTEPRRFETANLFLNSS